ncbi:helix-turn-helix domain-containing protein [Modestobacter sp. VKM Ac-2979]|uniref:AraC-like ligand-binding domain-containing protein n=1 Tax=unclassified Modestobacter TaxID=2643866 RepID=UPI0022ABBDAB|nr:MULTISPECIES: helix-turn-helix domain-containing protein [unclassified Modestobacter]MCZ2811723.1 helix-turn-helix domain-containing protein [Modestobacter sp. VKM Ac-2979]MCZ2843446.1 helix-turn-helix domain-containing protein [Modestobacter sp. VKM Ac-2980]
MSDAVCTGRSTAPTWSFEAFQEAVSATFVPLSAQISAEAGFAGRVVQADVGPLHLAEVTAGQHVVRRTSRLVRRPDPDFYKLSLQVEGRGILSQDGRDAVLRPGDLALYDTTRPYTLRFDAPFRMVVLMFRRPLLRLPEASVRVLAGQRIDGDHGLGTLVGPFLSGLPGQLRRCAPGAGANLADAVLDMLVAALMDELEGAALPVPGSRQAALLHRVKAFIEERLADPELDPATIAVAHHISPRYLRKLFESEGESVGRWIRRRRLEQCRQDLTRPELLDQPLHTVAARWCFTDPAHFSRLFKATYGQSPRSYRSGRPDAAPGPRPASADRRPHHLAG